MRSIVWAQWAAWIEAIAKLVEESAYDETTAQQCAWALDHARKLRELANHIRAGWPT